LDEVSSPFFDVLRRLRNSLAQTYNARSRLAEVLGTADKQSCISQNWIDLRHDFPPFGLEWLNDSILMHLNRSGCAVRHRLAIISRGARLLSPVIVIQYCVCCLLDIFARHVGRRYRRAWRLPLVP